MTDAAGEHLKGLEDSYDQIHKMAIGGMAEVFLGRQKNLDRPVAIKRIRPEYRANRDLQERFRREARVSANLLHQNLAHVYDYRKVGEDAYIIMEYIDGFDLAEVLERTGPLPIDLAVMVGVRILHGLAHVHSHGTVHRDLKPDNIRMSTRGEVKIMDFGIALDPSEANLTMPGVLIGSPHYLSPEQVSCEKVDPRADLFAFGITLYEILTGKKPFFETQSESVYSRIKKGDFIPPENIRPDIPPLLIKVIESCLQVNPLRRPASASVLAGTLTEFLVHHYSLAFELRTRQYLLQTGLLPGNPALIEIHEKTASGREFRFFSRLVAPLDAVIERLVSKKGLFWPLLLMVLGLAALGVHYVVNKPGLDIKLPAAFDRPSKPTSH